MNVRVRVLVALSTAALCFLIAACKPEKTADPVSVVKAEFDAINNGQADTAAELFAEDAEWISAFRQSTGASAIRDMLRLTTIPTKTRLTIRDISAEGPTVTGTFTMESSVVPEGVIVQLFATVQKGKIQFMAWTNRQ